MLRTTGMIKWVVLEVTGPSCIISEEKVAADNKGLKMGKSAGPTGVVSDMMNTSSGFGTRWMTDMINNIVQADYIPDDWRKSILVYIYTRGKVTHLCAVHTEIRLLEQPMKVLGADYLGVERVLETRMKCQVSIAATAVIKNVCMKFRQLLPFLISRALPLEMQFRVYASWVKSSMTYGNETRYLLVVVLLRLERSEMKMIRWMFGISMKDRSTGEKLRGWL